MGSITLGFWEVTFICIRFSTIAFQCEYDSSPSLALTRENGVFHIAYKSGLKPFPGKDMAFIQSVGRLD